MKGKMTKKERVRLAEELAAVAAELEEMERAEWAELAELEELLAYSPHAAEVNRILDDARRRLTARWAFW